MQRKTPGKFIAELRKEKSMTQKELAEILNVSDKTVSHWEREESSPDISLLLLIADTFSITVDELLRGERNPTEATENISYSKTYFPNVTDDIFPERLFGKFKIQSLISLAISVFSLLLGTGLKELFSYFVYSGAANTFAACIILCGVLVCIICCVIFTSQFKNRIRGTEYEKEYSFRAIRISSLIIYFAIFCFCLFLCFVGRDTFLYITIDLLITVIAEIVINKKLLNAKNAFASAQEEKTYVFKRSCILSCAILFTIGGFFHFFASEIYTPHPENIIFHSAEEFKAYMETPKEKPADAYLVDAVEMTVAFSTPSCCEDEQENTEEPQSDILYYGPDGKKILKFRLLNKSVYDYAYSEAQDTFHVITYQAKIRTEKIKDFCDITVGRIMPLYYVVSMALCFAVCRKKVREIQ